MTETIASSTTGITSAASTVNFPLTVLDKLSLSLRKPYKIFCIAIYFISK